MRRLLLLSLILGTPVFADDLVPGEGEVYVRAHCGACHSLKLVTAQRGDREFWLNTIRWMQKTQNLWPLPDEQEALILDYLAAHYNESEWGRRPAIPASLMPATDGTERDE